MEPRPTNSGMLRPCNLAFKSFNFVKRYPAEFKNANATLGSHSKAYLIFAC